MDLNTNKIINQNSNTLSKTEYDWRMRQKFKKACPQTEKSIIGFFIKNYRFTYLILFSMIILGIFTLLTLPKESDPEIKVPFAVVTTIYPGSNPTDTENLITNKLEKEINNLDNLKIYKSDSNAGVSNIYVEFVANAKLEESFRKLREAIDRAKNKLPSEAETPLVNEINFSDIPIVTYSLIGDYSKSELKKMADSLQNALENIQDVSRVDILGGLTEEYQIIINKNKLEHFNLSLEQINQAIKNANLNLPAGNIKIDGFNYDVRVQGKIKQIVDLEKIVVTTYNNAPIMLGDIAQIIDGFKEAKTFSRLGTYQQKSQDTISLQIRKKTGGNILRIVNNANKKIQELKTTNILPTDLQIAKTNDNSVFIKKDINTLGISGLQTMLLITLILLLILSFSGAIITSLAVPFAFLNAFIFLKLADLTLNSMVLFALVLSLGLMVDNAIIIIEGVNEYISKYQKTPYEAALLSIWNYKWAITSGTLTTVVAFLPMLLVSGVLGQYISILPKTITITLLSSLFVALIIIPTLVSRFLKIKKNTNQTRNKKRHLVLNALFQKMHNFYRFFMAKLLNNKKQGRLLILTTWLILFIALAIPLSGLMRVEMFAKIDVDYFMVNIETPIGATLATNNQIAQQVEKIIAQIPEIENYVINIGSSAASGMAGDNTRSASHLSGITINLIDKKQRHRTSYEIAENLRNKLNNITTAKITVDEISAGPPSGAPIEVRLSGDDYPTLDRLSQQIINFFQQTSGVINVKDNLENSAGEFVFTINKQKANAYGLSTANIALTLRNAIYGSTAGIVNVNGDDVDIVVKYADTDFRSINDLRSLSLTTKNNQTVSINELATIRLAPSLLSIKHRNGQKTAIINADLKQGANLKTILTKFSSWQKDLKLPTGYTINVGGEVEDIQKSFQEIFLSMILSILLISIILVLQFNSFKQSLLIIFALPLAFIGVIFGLNILHMPFSFLVFIGIVSLSGIVVNDAIVLIDRINKNITNGLEFKEAIIDAGITRMQPIFLTSLTTIAGVFPLIYADELWRSFSITLIFGLTFATFLTLVIIPLYYFSLCKNKKIFHKQKTAL